MIPVANLNAVHGQGEEGQAFPVDDWTEQKSEVKDFYSRELKFIEA